jgi:hypothetical protein
MISKKSLCFAGKLPNEDSIDINEYREADDEKKDDQDDVKSIAFGTEASFSAGNVESASTRHYN